KSENRVPTPAYADPFQAFRAQMDKLAEGFFGGGRWVGPFPAPSGNGEGLVLPSIDVKEDDQAVVLTAELPGMDEKDVELTVRNGLLTLKGEKKHEYEETKDQMHVMERRYGSVQRSWRLPEEVDPAGISAKFDKGVLTVTMKKRPETKPASQKIDITH
ncbi:MAG: Hsp20/alpha crystallin family protein, partial [Pseudomonadota bacterium]